MVCSGANELDGAYDDGLDEPLPVDTRFAEVDESLKDWLIAPGSPADDVAGGPLNAPPIESAI